MESFRCSSIQARTDIYRPILYVSKLMGERSDNSGKIPSLRAKVSCREESASPSWSSSISAYLTDMYCSLLKYSSSRYCASTSNISGFFLNSMIFWASLRFADVSGETLLSLLFSRGAVEQPETENVKPSVTRKINTL